MNNKFIVGRNEQPGSWIVRPTQGRFQLWFERRNSRKRIKRVSGVVFAYANLDGVNVVIADEKREQMNAIVSWTLMFQNHTRVYTLINLEQLKTLRQKHIVSSNLLSDGIPLIEFMNLMDGRMDELLSVCGVDRLYIGDFGPISDLMKMRPFSFLDEKVSYSVSPISVGDEISTFVVRKRVRE